LVCLFSFILLTQPFISCNNVPRDFIKSFFEAITQNEYVLNEGCFGTGFDADLEKLMLTYQERNFLEAAMLIQKIWKEINAFCPVQDFHDVFYKLFESVITKNVFKPPVIDHIIEILEIIRDELSEPVVNSANLGKSVGGIVRVLINKETPALKFLQYQGAFKIYDPVKLDLFFSGIFEGIAKVPEVNNCKNDILVFKQDIIDIVEAFGGAWDAKDKTMLTEVFKQIYELLKKIVAADKNCHFLELSLDLIAMTTVFGWIKTTGRLVTHMPSMLTNIKSFIDAVKAKDFKQDGFWVGKIFSVMLNYSTD